ncbi:MAG: metal-dependent hydrolase [Rhodospirillaceae bacterium]|nr:metal-dependent hydrolase [Rhodospirillaceae bacterium]
MPDSGAHSLIASISIGGAVAAQEIKSDGKVTVKTVGYASVAALSANLPDIIEPALNPHHRQFFHSVVFLLTLSVGLYQLYQWKPETIVEQIIRGMGLAIGSAYIVHLLADSLTKRSLPLVGKI